MNKLKVAAAVLAAAIIGGAVTLGATQRWPVLTPLATAAEPRIYVMKFGVTINKFLVINDRLHLVVPLPVTGESGKVAEIGRSGTVIEIDKVSKEKRKGK